MKNFLKERQSGIFLLTFAFILITSISLGHKVQSSNDANLSGKNQPSSKTEIDLDGGELAEVASEVNQDGISEVPFDEIEKEEENKIAVSAVKAGATSVSKTEAEKYSALKEKLKKYCDKKYESKKCKKYLTETKALFKTNKDYKRLYEKYLEKKEEREADDSDDSDDSKRTQISLEEKALTLDFIIKLPSGESKFEIQFMEGETVYEVMKRAKEQGKISYEKNTDETYGVYINTINGIKEGSEDDWTQNKYWILFVSGSSSNLGCSSHKLNKSDTAIEWRYEKYSF
jgi:hypothetical protein